MCPYNKSALPTLVLYAGSTKNLYVPVTNKMGVSVDVCDCSARLSVINCVHKNSRPVISKDAILVEGASDTLLFALSPEDTINLEGKFIYQIWIIGSDGLAEEPQQGELYIKRNIDKTFYQN